MLLELSLKNQATYLWNKAPERRCSSRTFRYGYLVVGYQKQEFDADSGELVSADEDDDADGDLDDDFTLDIDSDSYDE